MTRLAMLSIVAMLLAAYVASRSPAGPIHDAARKGDVGQIEKLLRANPTLVNTQDAEGNTPSGLAYRSGNRKAWELLLRVGAEMTIHESATIGGSGDIERLLKKNPKLVNSKNPKGITPLHIAVEERGLEMAKFLLAHGADPNLGDSTGRTPLHWAASQNWRETPLIVESLIAKGARINIFSKDGLTPLHLAALSGSVDIARILIAKGANVNARTLKSTVKPTAKGSGGRRFSTYPVGFTPLRIANYCQQRDMAELIRANGGKE